MIPILGRNADHGFDEPLALLSDCHRRIEMFLDVLIRVCHDFGGGPLTPEAADAVAKARTYFANAAPKHTADEEESLFPRMRAAASAAGKHCEVIDRLNDDHEAAQGLHARVDGLLEEWLRVGPLSPQKAVELSALLSELHDLYRGHIHVEDNEVFPLAGELLSAQDLAAVGSEMSARRGHPGPRRGEASITHS